MMTGIMENVSNCRELITCLCCGNDKLKKALDLNKQPLANSYLTKKDEHEEYYPLALNYCPTCTHLQLTHAVNPDLLFKNYLYVSGTTKTLRDYFDYFVSLTNNYFEKQITFTILDIACNDGSQLDAYKKQGHYTYGIDPAENLYKISRKKHHVTCDYFSEAAVNKLPCHEFDIIVAQNVFAHNTYPKTFLETCKKHLSAIGKIFIQTSQADMVKYGQFDTIYHEHISFFNVKSIVALLNGTNLYLQDVVKTNIHGTSYVFVLSQDINHDNSKTLIDQDFANTPEVIENFSRMAISVVSSLKEQLLSYKEHAVFGYGAAAKGNTLLNFGNIDLDYIVDDNTLKHNLYTPGKKIPIVSLNKAIELAENKPIVWIPLSWNFFDEIKKRIKLAQETPATFIKYFPQMEIIKE